ncbi:aspartate aminotransferase family protein [Defluviimonas sp. WL0002]|uniref:Aspartate aminotransferase family protein n=1 Tax=Albidovulum marisflavi TaxID=2984159 RepID=A0ABT2Z8W5_9RHOB|nr:aspartate aminotransferase family protein [Defluviimonas sp. WL0002]MCV2867460.1 aspartate aminotransferase family protein [Defluviimonas sp. WL0002]
MDSKIPSSVEETLDPRDWEELQGLAHRVIDDAIAHVRDVRDRPVWKDMPTQVREAFAAPLPNQPHPLSEVYRELQEELMPYPMGNIHPRFWMWYMGAGSFSGALAEFIAAIDGSNLGGGNHAAALIDRQVVAWLKQMMGFPESAGGTLVSGGSMANIIGLTAARNAMAGIDVRTEGVAAMPQQLRFYGSDQIHSCHQKAVELLGLGNKALRRVPAGPDFRMDISALREMITEDRQSGHRPACVIATAGTVNTGAIDDLRAISELCRVEGLWFHVDGCIGALAAIAPENRHLVSGLEAADSIALDPHKWLHVPFEAGCALVRDANTHRNTFAVHPEYLEEKPRGIAACEYLHDYNLQTSRAFRALKIWLTLKEHGVEKFGRLIDQNIAQARYLSSLIERAPDLQLMAPTTINIVCFRYSPGKMQEPALRELNTEIMLRMQETGIAAVSDTYVSGHHCLRAAICNHRTKRADLDLLIREVSRIGSILTNCDGVDAMREK